MAMRIMALPLPIKTIQRRIKIAQKDGFLAIEELVELLDRYEATTNFETSNPVRTTASFSRAGSN